MLRRLAILVVLAFDVLGCAQNQVPSNGGQQQERPKAQTDTSHPSAPSWLPQDTKKEGASGKRDTEEESKAKKYLEDAFAAANLSNWVLAGLGVVGGIIAGLTLRTVFNQTKILRDSVAVAEKAADAAETSAKAALQQATTMAEAERAWVVEILHFGNEVPRRGPNWQGGAITAAITFKNIGQQPAMIQMVSLRFITIDKLPNQPWYSGGAILPDGYLLAPTEERSFRCVLDQGSLEDDEVDQIEAGRGLRLYIYGRVVYKSMGVTGINQFSYEWDNLRGFSLQGDKPKFRKGGPSGYNSHT